MVWKQIGKRYGAELFFSRIVPTFFTYKMLQILKSLFRIKLRPPMLPFIDPVLGEFAFDSNLGWKKNVAFDETQAELVIGYNLLTPPFNDKFFRRAKKSFFRVTNRMESCLV